MQDDGKIYLTEEGKKNLETELAELEGPRRQEIAARLKSAIEMGDLSENADYHKAKEDQGFLEGKIQEIKHILHHAEIIEDNHKVQNLVTVGSRVTVQEDGSSPETFYLVGSKEADPAQNRISHASPIGRALLEKQPGDQVTVKTPGGEIELTILEIN
jgi:transcription elongation factor GreA